MIVQLPKQQQIAAIKAQHRENLCITMVLCKDFIGVIFADGTYTRMYYDKLTNSPNVVVDYNNPKIIDCGNTITFGDYEVSVKWIRENGH